MSKRIRLYCPDPPGLKLGPGTSPGEYIAFARGFAAFDEAEFPEWQTWVNHTGTPHIEVLPDDSGQIPADEIDAIVCPECGKAFASKFALTGHLRSHAPA